MEQSVIEESNERFTNRRSLSLHGPVVQVAQHQLELQNHLLQGMSHTQSPLSCGEVHTCMFLYRATPSPDQPKSSSEEDYLFVKQPLDDFFCPVTFGLLLQPHQTSCCGNHISQEAASKIQREEGACPLCKTRPWSSYFSKHFQRQVKSLHVFCRHDDGGCAWQGELVKFNSHVQSCPMRDTPLMTELMKLPM